MVQADAGLGGTSSALSVPRNTCRISRLGQNASVVGLARGALVKRYVAIVKLSEAGAECWPAASVAVMTSS